MVEQSLNEFDLTLLCPSPSPPNEHFPSHWRLVFGRSTRNSDSRWDRMGGYFNLQSTSGAYLYVPISEQILNESSINSGHTSMMDSESIR